ncbi:Mrp/NBP35 family ATP-binding protein [Guggenheimella bovis]
MPKTLPTKQKSNVFEKLHMREGSHATKVYAISSGKGGVGKSTTTALLAASLSAMGKRVGVLDGDITGPSIPSFFGALGETAIGTEEYIHPVVSPGGVKLMSLNFLVKNPADPVIWRSPVIIGLLQDFYSKVTWGPLDVLLIDMPPGTGDIPLTTYQHIPLDGIIVVTSPQKLVGLIVEKSIRMAQSLRVPIVGVIENMSYFKAPDTGHEYEIFGPSSIDELASRLQTKVLAKLPIDPELTKYTDAGAIEEYVATHQPFHAKDLEALNE